MVREFLQERGLKLKDLAEQIGMRSESLSRTLQGNPQYRTLKKIAEYFNVSVRDLFRVDENNVTVQINTEQANKEMKSCIFYNDEMYTFNSRSDLENFLKENK
ncbi:MAG: helix-turn-helix domain-containing protein [Candidatus Limimorpha sp.]